MFCYNYVNSNVTRHFSLISHINSEGKKVQIIFDHLKHAMCE